MSPELSLWVQKSMNNYLEAVMKYGSGTSPAEMERHLYCEGWRSFRFVLYVIFFLSIVLSIPDRAHSCGGGQIYVTLSANKSSITEGDASGVTVTVTRNLAYGGNITVNLQIAAGSSGNPIEFGDALFRNNSSSAISLTITPSNASTSTVIDITDDSILEYSENFRVSITSISPGEIDPGSPYYADVRIDDNNDDPPTVKFTAATGSNVTEGSNIYIGAEVSYKPQKEATVDVVFIPSAAAGAAETGDLGTTSRTYTFPADASSFEKIQISYFGTIDDSADEVQESLKFGFSNLSNCTLGSPAEHTLKINDNDPQPTPIYDNAPGMEADY